MAQGVFGAHSLHLHVICLLRFSLEPLRSLSHCLLVFLSCSSTSMWSKPPRNKTTALTRNEEECFFWRYTTLSQGMSPTSSTISTSQRPIRRHGREVFVLVRYPAHLRQAYHSYERKLVTSSVFFTEASTGRPVYEPSSSQKQ